MRGKLSCLQWAAILTAVLFVLCAAVGYAGIRFTRDIFVPDQRFASLDMADLTIDHPETASFHLTGNGLQITPLSNGQAVLMAGDDILAIVECHENGFALEQFSGRYTGNSWVLGAVLMFLLGTVIILAAALRMQLKRCFYHYASPLLTGLLLLTGLMLLLITVQCLFPGRNTLENTVSFLPSLLLLFTLPLMVLFTLAMFVSNLSLLRHEGRTWRNLLGSMIGFVLSLAVLIIHFNSDFSGSLEDMHLHDFLLNFFSGIVLWTECKLAGIILCAIRAAGNQPTMDKDYILILGCMLSRKGGLTPLLRGRVDRALRFARQQEQKTGHMPMLIPCGGKGKNELRSEASAMKEYLLEQGVPESDILAEDRSVNTWENIRNAKTMMQPGAKVAYATTNYHVFRAGVWASRNGLEADGMGSSTKWYYWPNAFMREYVALIVANLLHEVFMLLLIGIQSGLLAYLYR